MSRGYPNNHCGECPIWLAIDEPDGISRQQAIQLYCKNCKVTEETYVEFDH